MHFIVLKHELRAERQHHDILERGQGETTTEDPSRFSATNTKQGIYEGRVRRGTLSSIF